MTKKILSLFACAALLASCNNEKATVINQETGLKIVNPLPQTEIYVQGQRLLSANPQSRADYNWPMHTDAFETAYFRIRADGNKIVGIQEMPSAQFFGRTPGKAGNNKGKVSTLYPYGRYNDRDFDYYQTDKKTGQNIGLFRFLLDNTGQNTQLAITEAPMVEDILADEKADLQTAIANGQDVAKNIVKLAKVDSLLSLGSQHLNSHVLWYVVKEVGTRYGWQVNGIIGADQVPEYTIDTSLVPDDVDIDIHQQIRAGWNEIKTLLRIRTDVESITINIPLKQEDIIEQDHFTIRAFNFDNSEYHIAHTISHDSNGITIEISNIPDDLIQNLKQDFGEGLTIEINSYCTIKDNWEQLSQSCVVSTGKPCTVNGQIHSTMHPESEIDPLPLPVKEE